MLRPPGAHEDQRGGGVRSRNKWFGTSLLGGTDGGVSRHGLGFGGSHAVRSTQLGDGGFLRTRTRVGVQHRNALLARGVLEETLLGAVVGGTGQAGEVNE